MYTLLQVFVVGDYFLDRRALRAKMRGIFKNMQDNDVEKGQCVELGPAKVVSAEGKINA